MFAFFHQQNNITKGILLLAVSSFLFSSMGVLIRYASQTVDNTHVVFFRNLTALFLLLPWFARGGLRPLITNIKTDKLWMHLWRSVIGLTAMYGFFYAIAHMKLSNAMVFTYASPIFIPLVAWLFLKEAMTWRMWLAALLGFVGVVLVAKPDTGMFNTLSFIGIGASFCAAMAFVTVRALTNTEPATRIVFYFALIGTLISALPVLADWQSLNALELMLLVSAGTLATLSQVAMSQAYAYAPAGTIGPTNYLAIIIAGFWGALLWQEYPDLLSVTGMLIILVAILLCMPNFLSLIWQKFKP